jgi:hypothetical protein
MEELLGGAGSDGFGSVSPLRGQHGDHISPRNAWRSQRTN